MGRPNTQNLIPLNLKTKERQREIQVLGGKANKNNPKTILAARLRELKKKGLTDDYADKLTQIFESSDASALDIFLYLEQIKKQCDKPMVMIQLADKYISLHKTIHGEKIKTENINTNINLNIDVLKYQELLKKYEN